MDRNNGGDPLAPPRPPKLLPRVHRPRAPEPTMVSRIAVAGEVTRIHTSDYNTTTLTATIEPTSQPILNITVTATPQCTNGNQQHLNNSSSQHQNPSITLAAELELQNNLNVSHTEAYTSTEPDYDTREYPTHHLTLLPPRPNSESRNRSHVNSASLSPISVTNTFTRRRLLPSIPGAAISLPNITNTAHIGSADPVHGSPVTLAQPRPESERLTNEYVDTPLRSTHQLQHATRSQHPAGQHDSGQTTTRHLLLLPQRELTRLQQQQHQQHSSRLTGTAGSATVTTGTDGTDGNLRHSTYFKTQVAATQTTCPHTGKLTPATVPPGLSSSPIMQPITHPITKQPASSSANHNCKFAKDIPAFDELLDLHNIATGIPTPQGIVSAVAGASPIGTPIIIGGDPVNPITCPRCARCRCEQCQSPRSLPETWVCNKTCLCSAESVIDYASCLCCAKALFYHCARDNDMDCDDDSGTSCVDNPCSCGPYKRTHRWGWLSALSVVLPCLCLYWPMRGCVILCEKCYGRFSGRGCRCQQIGSTASMPIVPLSDNDNITVSNGGRETNGNIGRAHVMPKTTGVSGKANHHHHHNECSSTNRNLRKGDVPPEKRLLDTSPEY